MVDGRWSIYPELLSIVPYVATVPAAADRSADLPGSLIYLPAGTAQLAVGASYRQEYTRSTVDTSLVVNADTLTCTLGSQCTSPLQGGYHVREIYAELFVPLLREVPFVHALNVTLGDRYSKYSSFGNTSNGKFALESELPLVRA